MIDLIMKLRRNNILNVYSNQIHNLKNFLDAGYVDLQTAVWQGVLCHLMGDKAFYFKSYCIDIERIFCSVLKQKCRTGVYELGEYQEMY